MVNKVVTRFAPSPTGFMHIGGVRTALYAWLWARKNNGTFILRIEDTDKEREVGGSMEHIIESLKWLGIEWDEGPDVGGPNAPYIQSQRLDSYKKYAQILIDKGYAYPDPYTKEELDEFRKKADAEKRPFLYRNHRPKEFGVWDGTKALRFKTPEIKSYKWTDAVRGKLSAGVEALDDFILIKSDGYPTYNFAHVIDDLEMGVTCVMRADEFISSTPKFLSLYEALNITPPQLVSFPPILAEGGNKKLGKRDGAKDILDYRDEGYLPEAMMNFLALLGWNPGTPQEIFTQEELTQAFDITKIQISGAQVNLEKLDWINKEHMKKLSKKEIKKEIFKRLPKDMRNPKLIPIILERISKWSDIKKIIERRNKTIPTTDDKDNKSDEFKIKVTKEESISGSSDYLIPLKDPLISKFKLVPKDMKDKDVIKYLTVVEKLLEKIPEDQWGKIEKNDKNNLWIYSGKEGRGKVLWPLRMALSGEDKSIDLFEILKVIGKDSSLRRIKKALKTLKKSKYYQTQIKISSKQRPILRTPKEQSHTQKQNNTFTFQT